MGLGDTQWLAGQCSILNLREGWLGRASWESSMRGRCSKGHQEECCGTRMPCFSIWAKSGYKAKMVKLLWAQEFCLLCILFPQQQLQLLSHLCLLGLCSSCCSFPAMSKGGSFQSIYIKQRSVLLSGFVCNLSWLVVFPTTILTVGMVLKLLLRNPRFALQLSLEFDKISSGAY